VAQWFERRCGVVYVTKDQLQQQRADLQRKLDARKNTPGYAESCKMIEAKIAGIDEELNRLDG